jgi:hypothetical protein
MPSVSERAWNRTFGQSLLEHRTIKHPIPRKQDDLVVRHKNCIVRLCVVLKSPVLDYMLQNYRAVASNTWACDI